MYCTSFPVFLQDKYGRPFWKIRVILYYDSCGDRCHDISDEDIVSRQLVITMVGYFCIAGLDKRQDPQK